MDEEDIPVKENPTDGQIAPSGILDDCDGVDPIAI